MKIYSALVRNYVTEVLDARFDLGDVLEDPSELDEPIDRALSMSRWNHQEEALRLSLAHLLARPGFDLSEFFIPGLTCWSDEEMRPVLEHMYKRLWPDHWPIPAGGPPDVEIVKTPAGAWNVSMRYGPDAPPGRAEREASKKR